MSADIRRLRRRAARRLFLVRKKVHQSFEYGAAAGGAKCRVFVAGVQRSGTNMFMDVLERSLETAVFHETDSRAFSNYIMRDVETIRGLSDSSRPPVIVIKALCESQRLLSLLEEFRPAKAVWIFRHYGDVVNSMLRSFTKHAVHISRIAEDRSSADWRGEGMSDETHAMVRRFARPDLNAPTAAALMWYLRNVLYFEQRLDSDPRSHLIHYDSLVSDPRTEFRKAFEFLGLRYSDGLVRDVYSSSVGKRPLPEIDEPVAAVCETLYERLTEDCRDR